MGLIGEIERLNNTFVSEKNRNKREKKDKKQTQTALFNYFYKQFRKAPHDYENIYIDLQYINKREKIIDKMLVNNTASIEYINNIYTKTLKNVYNIFKNNYKFLQEREKEESPPEEEEEEQKKELNWSYFWQVIGIILLFPFVVLVGIMNEQGKRRR